MSCPWHPEQRRHRRRGSAQDDGAAGGGQPPRRSEGSRVGARTRGRSFAPTAAAPAPTGSAQDASTMGAANDETLLLRRSSSPPWTAASPVPYLFATFAELCTLAAPASGVHPGGRSPLAHRRLRSCVFP